MAKPFTVPHFKAWASDLYLDNGDPWIVEDFQADFLRDVFRGFAESWLIIPEGNAKTTLAGGFVLYHAQHMKQARVPVAASSRDQAEWLYQAAAGFVERSEVLGRIFRCQEGYRRIRCDSVGSRVQIFAADDRTGDGVIPTLCLLEELHRHRSLNLYRTWRGKLLKRGGQLVAISTAGDPEGEFEATREKIRAEAVETKRKGSFTRYVGKGIVVHDYAVPEGANVENMREVKKANPLKAITPKQLREKRDTPTMTLAHWRRFVCGQPSNGNESPITAELWDSRRADIGTIQPGEAVVAGISTSVNGYGAIGLAVERHDGVVAVAAEVLEPKPGISMLAQIEKRIPLLPYDVVQVVSPRSNFIRSQEILEGEGEPVEDAPHSNERSAAVTGTFFKLLYGGQLIHDGDPVLRKHALATATKISATGEKIWESESCRAIVAVAFAAHYATAPRDDLRMVLPTGAVG